MDFYSEISVDQDKIVWKRPIWLTSFIKNASLTEQCRRWSFYAHALADFGLHWSHRQAIAPFCHDAFSFTGTVFKSIHYPCIIYTKRNDKLVKSKKNYNYNCARFLFYNRPLYEKWRNGLNDSAKTRKSLLPSWFTIKHCMQCTYNN